jgi:hypothetical protein
VSGGGGRGKVLTSDYFGYDHYRSPNAYSSCESFKGADITKPPKLLSADFWFGQGDGTGGISLIKLHAGFVDGHVDEYSSFEVVPMKVIIDPETNEPYENGVGPGIFYLPRNGLR